MSDPDTTRPQPASPPLKRGDKVEQYTIRKQVGSGGSSVVFKAKDDLLGHYVAVKQVLMPGGEGDKKLRKKIRTEAKHHKTATKADPKRLVQLLDVVDGPHGLLLISEFIDGPSLEQILAQNPLPMDPKQAMGIIAAAAMALEAIHRQGVVHLDLKPANILMPRTGGLKISDFGLAAGVDDRATANAGTARYMAPELLRGEKVDGRTDLYALGMMTYEMIAGREKFDQAFRPVLRDQHNQAARWMKWHTNKRAKPPALGELVPGVPPQLVELVGQMMEKDPDKRIGSAEQLLKAIRYQVAGKDLPTDIDPAQQFDDAPSSQTSPGDTAALPPRKRAARYWIAGATVCVLLCALGGLLLIGQGRGARRAQVQQAHQTMTEAGQAYREGSYTEALLRFQKVIDRWPARSEIGRHARAGALLAQGRIDADADRYDQALSAFQQASAMGEVYEDKARPLIDDTRQAKAFDQTVKQIESMIEAHAFGEARKKLDGWRDLTTTETERQALRAVGARLEDQQSRWRVRELIEQANALNQQGKRGEAIELLKDSPKRLGVIELLEQLEADAVYDQAVALAEDAEARGDLEEAIHQYQLARDARSGEAFKDKLIDLQSRWLVEEGLRLLALGDTVGADQKLTEALGFSPDNQRAREALAGIASSSRRSAFISAGDTAMAKRNFDTALRQYKNALALGVDDGLTVKMTEARVQNLLTQSRAALLSGRVDEAIDLVGQASQLASDSPDVAAALHEVEVRGAYLRHLSAGDQALGRSAFGQAKRHYRHAKEAMDTPQIRARLDEAEYDHILAQARDFIAAEEYPSAKAQLQIAAGIRMTDEIRLLLDEVSAKDPETDQAAP